MAEVFIPVLLATSMLSLVMLRAIWVRLPDRWDGAAVRRPLVAGLWVVLSLLALSETARVSTFMSDRSTPGAADWMLQRVADHDCMGGYVYGADLNRKGDPNVYDISHYPLGTPGVDARPDPGIPADATRVANLAPYVLDNLQYAPPFLLVPRAALAVTNDYLRMRTVWFVLQWFGLAVVAFTIATWVGGRSGAIMLLLIPVFLMSGPTSLGLQRGQFHPAAWALALGAMLAFEYRRNALGGAMLAFAVWTKIFPGVLGIYLIVTRRWSAVAWTFGAAAAWIVLTFLVAGSAPFERFVVYQLPRITSGDAFAWCFDRLTCVINNQAPYGLPFKLFRLGWLSEPLRWGEVIRSVFPLAVVAIAVWAGLRAPSSRRTPEERAVVARTWTSIAMVASLMPNLVPATYSPMGSFLTLMLLAGLVRSWWAAALLALAWISAFQLPASPTSDFKVGLSFVTAVVLLGVNAWTAITAKVEAASTEPS